MISSSLKNVRSRVVTALESNANPQLRFIRVDLRENTVCLSGQVRSFYHKQLVQEIVRSIDDEVEVCNDLRVAPSDS